MIYLFVYTTAISGIKFSETSPNGQCDRPFTSVLNLPPIIIAYLYEGISKFASYCYSKKANKIIKT